MNHNMWDDIMEELWLARMSQHPGQRSLLEEMRELRNIRSSRRRDLAKPPWYEDEEDKEDALDEVVNEVIQEHNVVSTIQSAETHTVQSSDINEMYLDSIRNSFKTSIDDYREAQIREACKNESGVINPQEDIKEENNIKKSKRQIFILNDEKNE